MEPGFSGGPNPSLTLRALIWFNVRAGSVSARSSEVARPEVRGSKNRVERRYPPTFMMTRSETLLTPAALSTSAILAFLP